MSRLFVFLAAVAAFFLMAAGAQAGSIPADMSRLLGESRSVVSAMISRNASSQPATAELSRLSALKEELAALRLLQAEHNATLDSRAAALGGNAADRQQSVSSALPQALDDLISRLDAVITSGGKDGLQQLLDAINRLVPKRSRPLLGTLPYKHTNYPPREPATAPVITPAYKGGDRNVYAADTAASPEAPLSKEIVELAQSLQWNPVLIYEWVKNNVETEWYWGSMKGAEETLRQKSGNDADQASLLVALLRAANFPSRYVKGTIDFFPDIERARNLTGLDDPLKIAAFFQKAGIPFKPVIAGGRITNFHIEHIWVEAFIPYANYRGAVVDDQGKIWLGLDTSIKPLGYTRTIGSGVPTDLLSLLRDDYLKATQTLTPLEYLTGKLDEQLAVSQPGKTWKDLSDTAVLIPDVLKIIPDSMQFNQTAITGEYQSLPDDLKHKLTITATNNGSELFSITLETHKLSNRRLALRAEPETVEDQNLIDSFGGLDNTPAYLVRLRPVLTLDNERLIVAQDGLPMGADFTLAIDIVTPNTTERISSSQITGNLAVIGVVGQKAQTPAAISENDDAEAILFKEAIGYIERWNRAEDDLSALLGQRISRPSVTIATVGGQMEVTTLLDTPHDMQWKGVYLDAGYRRIESVGRNGQEKEFMRLSALQGSILENRIFEDDLKVDSVSTAKLLQQAKAGNTPVITVDKTNVDAVLPQLLFDDAVKADITNAVNQNLTVTIPQSEVAYQDWSGIGYVKENPATGESGWMLSGQVAGGMTVWSPDKWDDAANQAMSDALRAPYSGKPNTNPDEATSIVKIPVTDQQIGTVGQRPSSRLQVKVLDKLLKPVQGASVTFSIKAGGGSLGDKNETTVTIQTNRNGIASVALNLGQKTTDNPVYWFTAGNTYSDQYGGNIIDAELGNGIAVDAPFAAYGKPGPLSKLRPTYGQTLEGLILSYAGYVALIAEDIYGNPIANQKVTFTLGQPTVTGMCWNQKYDKTKALLVKAGDGCLKISPTISEATVTCKETAASITDMTSASGVWVGVILGGAPGANYPVTATTTSAGITFTAEYLPSTVNRYLCGEDLNVIDAFFISSLIPSDMYGNNINAGKSGSTISIMAKQYLLKQGETIDKLPVMGCYYLVCPQVVGDGTYSTTTDFVKSEALFNLIPANSLGNGLFQGNYTLQPGLNRIKIEGKVRYGFNRYANTCERGCEQFTTIEDYSLDNFTYVDVYGVDISINQPLNIMLNELDKSRNDLRINYAIAPSEYKSFTTTVALYKNGEVVEYIPADTKGGGAFATIARGYLFEINSKYEVQVILNYGTGVEIRSDRVPISIEYSPFRLERAHILSQFDSPVSEAPGTTFTDSYKIFTVNLDKPSAVSVTFLNADRSEHSTLQTSAGLPAGEHYFSLDYSQVLAAGFSPQNSPAFYLQVKITPADGTSSWSATYPGSLSERTTGKMLGQTVVHDVLIQDGALTLSRQDFAFKGRGPQLALSRSYTNQATPIDQSVMGEGWSHSLDLRLRPLAQGSGTGAVPDWVANVRSHFFNAGDIPVGLPQWATVTVNGTTFRKHNGAWFSERGRHGSLNEVGGKFVYIAKDGTSYRYDYPTVGPTFVESITDANGNSQNFTYSAGRLSTVTDAVGRSCLFRYGPVPGLNSADNSRLAAVTCSDGVEMRYGYNAQGYLVSATREARVETYGYAIETGIANGDYNLVKATDANGNNSAYEYFGPNEVVANPAKSAIKYLKSQDVVKKVTYPDNAFALFQYGMQDATRTVTDLRGYNIVYTLNYYGNPLRIDEPLGKTTRMTWSIDEGKNDNVMTSKTDGRGYTTTYEYDAKGNVSKETDPYNNSITTVWNQIFSVPEMRTDRNGVIRTWQYDAKGNLHLEKDGDNKQTSHTYYATGERETSTDPRGKTTRFSYDGWGNPASVKGAEGSETRYENDIRGRRTAMIDPNGKRTEYAYDALDNPTTTTLPQHSSYPLATGSSHIKTKSYDAVGNLVNETDRLGLTLAYTYTPRNQVKTITRSTGGTKTFDYDPNGNLLSEADWKGVATSHTYDELNRRVTITNRLRDSKGMKYDLADNLIEETDYEGRITNHEYDKLNRLTKTIQPALPGLARGELNYSYYNEADPKTNLKIETDQEGYSTTYEYNGRYQRSKRINALLDTHLWEYDDAGNLTRETDEEGRSVSHEYDGQNRLVADIRSHNGSDLRTVYGYDAADNRVSSTDPLNHTTKTRYDEWNRPWQTIDPENYTVTSELDGEGNKVKTVDASGGVRTWTRDQRGLVTSAIDAEGNETKSTFDLNNNPETVTFANTGITKFAYDAEDRKLLTTEAFGQPEERISGVILYDKVGNPLQVKDGNGNVTTTDYNALNLPIKVTDAKGKFSTSEYYKAGKVKSVTNRRGYTTTTDYDQLWRVTKVTDPLLKTIETTYDKVGNVRTVKDKRGIVSETVYDDLYRPVEKHRAGLKLVTMEYDEANNLIAETDAENNKTEYSYTKRNQKEKATYADSSYESYSYDGNGNLKTQTDEEGIVTTHGYDKENRSTSTERAGEETQKVYDPMGNLAAVIQPKGNSRGYRYDQLNRLIRVTDDEFGINLVTTYAYDKNNNRVKTTDPRGNVVESRYDELNRKTAHIQKKASGDLTASFEYDEEGNQTKLTDAKEQISTYVYDELNRKKSSSYSGLSITYDYDENNNLTGSSVSGTSSDSTINTYDDFDRLKTSTQRGTQISYTYDNNGNRLSVGTPTSTTSYTYDQRNRVKTATAGSDVTTFDYFKDGKKKSVTYPNGAGETYDYYPTNRVQAVTNSANGTTISRFDYIYDQNGNRQIQDETRGRRITTTYRYDTLDRMTSYSVTEGSNNTQTDYTFDGYNRQTETIAKSGSPKTSKTYSYDETDWLTQISDGAKTITYVYDNNGNTIRKNDSTEPTNPTIYAYDARDKLTSATKGTTTLGDYSYNAQGYRIWNRNSDRGDVEYLYDGTAVIEERNSSGLLAHYRYANKLYSLTDGTNNQYYHLDALGSTTDLTDAAGAAKTSYFLNPWGMIVDSIGDSVNRRVFTGKEIDQNTGLIYFGARYYDPDTARFITQDTYLGEQGTPPSLHRYLYAYSNPTVYVDLEGYSVLDVFNEIYGGVKKAVSGGYEGTKQAIGKGYNAGKDATVKTVKAIPKINRELSQLPDKIADSYTPTTTAGQAFATALHTVGKVSFEAAKLPMELASETVTFAQDRRAENIPIFGPVGTAIGQTTAEFMENRTIENGARMVGAYSGGALLAAGGAEVASAMRGASTTEAATLTTETRSARVSMEKSGAITNPFPENGIFSRVMPRKYAEAFSRGEGTLGAGNEIFIGAADDIAGISTVSEMQTRLSLFTDYEGTVPNISGDAVVQFKLRNIEGVGIRSPIETTPSRGYGFKHGGTTAGNAREWNINNGTASELGAYDLSIKYLEK